jgi:hypothetical protein
MEVVDLIPSAEAWPGGFGARDVVVSVTTPNVRGLTCSLEPLLRVLPNRLVESIPRAVRLLVHHDKGLIDELTEDVGDIEHA